MNQRFLVDANLSWRLVSLLKDDFSGITHIAHTELEDAVSDTKIWDYARRNDYHIITNDEDFYTLVLGRGFPPKVVLLRTGNQSTKYIAEILLKHRAEIFHFLNNPEYGVLEIF